MHGSQLMLSRGLWSPSPRHLQEEGRQKGACVTADKSIRKKKTRSKDTGDGGRELPGKPAASLPLGAGSGGRKNHVVCSEPMILLDSLWAWSGTAFSKDHSFWDVPRLLCPLGQSIPDTWPRHSSPLFWIGRNPQDPEFLLLISTYSKDNIKLKQNILKHSYSHLF